MPDDFVDPLARKVRRERHRISTWARKGSRRRSAKVELRRLTKEARTGSR